MSLTPTEIKGSIDQLITNPTIAYSIDNVDVGNLLKSMVDLFADVSPSVPKFEIVPFDSVADITILWTEDRKAKFGDVAQLTVEMLDADGVLRLQQGLEILPDSLVNTSSYHIDFGGGVQTGRVIIK